MVMLTVFFFLGQNYQFWANLVQVKLKYGTITRTGITSKKIPYYKRHSAYRWCKVTSFSIEITTKQVFCTSVGFTRIFLIKMQKYYIEHF